MSQEKQQYDYDLCFVTLSYMYSTVSKRVSLISISATRINENRLEKAFPVKSEFLRHIQPNILKKILGKLNL